MMKLAPVHSAPPRSRPPLAQQHVFSDGKMAKVCEFLVDRRNADFQRDARRTELCFTFLPNDVAAVRRINATEDFDESGFAGAVFTDQPQDFTRIYCQRGRFQCLDADERLFDFVQCQQRRTDRSVGRRRMLW